MLPQLSEQVVHPAALETHGLAIEPAHYEIDLPRRLHRFGTFHGRHVREQPRLYRPEADDLCETADRLLPLLESLGACDDRLSVRISQLPFGVLPREAESNTRPGVVTDLVGLERAGPGTDPTSSLRRISDSECGMPTLHTPPDTSTKTVRQCAESTLRIGYSIRLGGACLRDVTQIDQLISEHP